MMKTVFLDNSVRNDAKVHAWSLQMRNTERNFRGSRKLVIPYVKGPLQYLFKPLLGKNEFAVTQHMYAFIGPNLDNIH